MNDRTAYKKATIFAHYQEGLSGFSDFLTEYFERHGTGEFVHVRFPFLYSSDGAISAQTGGKNTPVKSFKSLIRFYKPAPLSYLKDFLYALWWGLRFTRGSDVLLATSNILALAGIFLRAIGAVKKVVYVTIDYTPRRYANPLANWFYFLVDAAASHGADSVWAFSEKMIKSKMADGRVNASRLRWQIISSGNRSDRYADARYQGYDRYRIAFLGGILKSKGAELFVPIVRNLVNRGMKELVLECAGGGAVDFLRQEAVRAGLERNIIVHGPLKDYADVERIMFSCAAAIAPYYPHDPNSFTFFADPAKIKDYLGFGLPVVLTDVPPIVPDIIKAGAGLVAGYSAEDFADKILAIIADEEACSQYRLRARTLGLQYSWTRIFERAFRELAAQ